MLSRTFTNKSTTTIEDIQCAGIKIVSKHKLIKKDTITASNETSVLKWGKEKLDKNNLKD